MVLNLRIPLINYISGMFGGKVMKNLGTISQLQFYGSLWFMRFMYNQARDYGWYTSHRINGEEKNWKIRAGDSADNACVDGDNYIPWKRYW